MGGKGFKIGIIVIALTASMVVYFWSGEESVQQFGPEPADLICESCGEHFQINADKLKELEIPGSVHAATEESGRSRRAALPRSTFPCEKCGQPTGVIARHCDTHDKWYANESAEGGPGKCPDCPR